MIVTIAHTKGGVGKSTLAWHIIFMFIMLGKRVKVIDLDFQQTTYFLNQIRVSSGLDGLEVEQPQDIEELISLLEDYDEDIVIVDIGGFDNDMNRTAISYADKILVPISNSVTEVLGFKTFEAILEDITTQKLDYPFVNVVLNNIHPLTKNFDVITEAIGNNPQMKLLKSIIRNRKVYKDTLGVGKSVLDTNDTPAIEDIKRLCDELTSH
ncbi:ParA family protein [Sulfurimonas sp.]|uniref:ParA family protein n=1 Tax=Sulfurimonas sp. TaxID=2022749 RepID=UPI0025FA39C3|nr:ParA family protein [Sulfurimonas sp.]